MTRRGVLLEVLFALPEYVLVDRSPFVIGRNRACDLPLHSGNVSRMHAEIVRDRERWLLRALRDEAIIDVDGARAAGPIVLAAGMEIRVGDHTLRVVALDHEAADGELTGPIRHSVRLASPGVTCALDFRITSSTGNADAGLALETLLRGLDPEDPISAIAAYRTLAERSREPIGAVRFQVELVRLELDANAIALLTEPAPPAQAMWDWLWRAERDALLAPAANIVGIMRTHPPDDVPPPALVAAAPAAPLQLWIRRGRLGQLARLDGALQLAWPESPDGSPPRVLAFEPRGDRWYLVEGDFARELVRDVPITVGYTTVLAL